MQLPPRPGTLSFKFPSDVVGLLPDPESPRGQLIFATLAELDAARKLAGDLLRNPAFAAIHAGLQRSLDENITPTWEHLTSVGALRGMHEAPDSDVLPELEQVRADVAMVRSRWDGYRQHMESR
jgi:hypothetical protein